MYDMPLLIGIQIGSILIAAGLGALFAHRAKKQNPVTKQLESLQYAVTNLDVRVEALEDGRKEAVPGHGKGGILLSTGETGSIPRGRRAIGRIGLRSGREER